MLLVLLVLQESRTREGAEAALEEELKPLVDKPLLERTGAVLGMAGW